MVLSYVVYPTKESGAMKSNKPDRLHDLCSQALVEKDPQKMAVLFSEINDILFEIVAQVKHVIRKTERADLFPHQNQEASATRYVC
jgi:hypothetical protein